MYEKNLDQYRSTSNLGLSAFEIMARIMDSAALCMNNAARAIRDNNIGRRSSESEKALMLLAGLMDFLSEETAEQKKTSETLKVYYKSMMDLITNLNLKPDQELAETLSQSFSEFAEAWRSAPTRLHSAKAAMQSEFLAQG